VIQKLHIAKLNPNERKKIISKKFGKWLTMSDDNGAIGVVACKEDYPERLAYKFINDCHEKLAQNVEGWPVVQGQQVQMTSGADLDA
jgi:hypothetical protein